METIVAAEAKVKTGKHKGIHIPDGHIPVFRDPGTLTKEQLTDPDYRLKSLLVIALFIENLGRITCSRCHHCR